MTDPRLLSELARVKVPIERKAHRRLLVEQQDGRCFYCDCPMTIERGPHMSTIDHVIPGEDLTVASCHQCNRMKGCMTPEQMRRMADRIDAAIAAAMGLPSPVRMPKDERA